jgi:hypothetical protein
MSTTPYSLANAVELAAEHPKTFNLPRPDDIAGIRVGGLAKLIFLPADGVAGKGERMWVQVTDINAFAYTGTLSNHPVILPMRHGDEVKFAAHNIIAVAPEEALQ